MDSGLAEYVTIAQVDFNGPWAGDDYDLLVGSTKLPVDEGHTVAAHDGEGNWAYAKVRYVRPWGQPLHAGDDAKFLVYLKVDHSTWHDGPELDGLPGERLNG